MTLSTFKRNLSQHLRQRGGERRESAGHLQSPITMLQIVRPNQGFTSKDPRDGKCVCMCIYVYAFGFDHDSWVAE